MGKVKVVLTHEKGRVLVMDSIAYVGETSDEDIIVCASHGGYSAGSFVLGKVTPRLVIYNDAGVGKDEAGTASLSMLQEVGIAAATVSNNSARIGDGEDTWENGIISHANQSASELGFSKGVRVKERCTEILK